MIALGKVTVTQRAHKAMSEADVSLKWVLERHVTNDVEFPDSECHTGESLATKGQPIMSLHPAGAGVNLLVITAADRSSTVVLLDEEY